MLESGTEKTALDVYTCHLTISSHTGWALGQIFIFTKKALV